MITSYYPDMASVKKFYIYVVNSMYRWIKI
jgi:hypothetical protein